MSETMGRLLAAGQRAEVFEWGSRVVKLYRSTGSKQVIFREAATAGDPTHALFAHQSHSIPDNLVALLGAVRAWNCSV